MISLIEDARPEEESQSGDIAPGEVECAKKRWHIKSRKNYIKAMDISLDVYTLFNDEGVFIEEDGGGLANSSRFLYDDGNIHLKIFATRYDPDGKNLQDKYIVFFKTAINLITPPEKRGTLDLNYLQKIKCDIRSALLAFPTGDGWGQIPLKRIEFN